MKNNTVAFLFIIALTAGLFVAIPTHALTVFTDDFENGLSAWNISKTKYETVTVTTNHARNGLRCLKATTDGLEAGEMAYAYRKINPMSISYVRAYIMFSVLPRSGSSWTPLNVRSRFWQPGALLSLEVVANSAGFYWRLAWRDSTLKSTIAAKLSGTIEANKWYCIELYVKVNVVGEVKCWIDGVQLYYRSVNNSEWGGMSYICIGERWSNKGGPHSTYVDAVAISDSYIPPIQPTPSEKVAVVSSFCQGDLYLPSNIDASTFTFHLRKDENYYWFYYSATPVTDRTLKFIINLTEYGGWGWFVVKQPVFSYTNTLCGDDWQRITDVKDTVSTNKLFTFSQPFTSKTVWIAPTFPFPYTQCYEWIKSINSTSSYAKASVAGQSQQGRDMIVTVITDFSIPSSNKKIIWFIAGQHPCETSGQIALKTMTDWLISSDPLAHLYRDKYEFHIVYEMNPDGNYLGKYRTDSLGRNLNRAWDDLKPPEVRSIYTVVNTTIRNGGKIDLWLDWHCSSKNYNFQFAISNITTSIPQELRTENNRLASLIQQYATGATKVVIESADYGCSQDEMANDFGINGICLEQGLAKIDTINSIRQFGLNVLTAIDKYFNAF